MNTNQFEILEYVLPVYWACALINGDESGMSEEDIEEMYTWLQTVNPGRCVQVSEDSWFQHGNDCNRNMGGDVATFTFHLYNLNL